MMLNLQTQLFCRLTTVKKGSVTRPSVLDQSLLKKVRNYKQYKTQNVAVHEPRNRFNEKLRQQSGTGYKT